MSDFVVSSNFIPVVHPLDDVREEKLFRPELGRIQLSRKVRASLLMLQAYLAIMLTLVVLRVLTVL